MSSSGFRPFRPAPDRTTARVLDPTRVFPGPGTGSGAAPDAEEPTAVRPRVIAGEIVRRRHRATRVRRRSPGVMGAAVLSATGAIVTLTLVVSQQSSHGPSGAGRHPVTSALGRPAEPRALPASPATPPVGGTHAGAAHATTPRPPTGAAPAVTAASPPGGPHQPLSAVADDLALTAVHGRGLHLGNGGPLGLLPPGLARG